MITNQKPRRIKILGFHRHDACHKRKEKYIGKTGMFTPDPSQYNPGYFAGHMDYDDTGGDYLCDYFYAVRYRRI